MIVKKRVHLVIICGLLFGVVFVVGFAAVVGDFVVVVEVASPVVAEVEVVVIVLFDVVVVVTVVVVFITCNK
jgi:hypothetical protein